MNCSLIFFIIVYAEVVILKETQKKLLYEEQIVRQMCKFGNV